MVSAQRNSKSERNLGETSPNSQVIDMQIIKNHGIAICLHQAQQTSDVFEKNLFLLCCDWKLRIITHENRIEQVKGEENSVILSILHYWFHFSALFMNNKDFTAIGNVVAQQNVSLDSCIENSGLFLSLIELLD